MKTERIASEITAPQYGVHDVNHYAQENKNLEIDEIFLRFCSKDRENQLGRKYCHINSRFLYQDVQEARSHEKSSLFRKTTGTYLDSVAGACSLAGGLFALAGIPGASTIGEGLGKTFSVMSNSFEKEVRAQEEYLGFASQRYRNLEQDQSQQIQSADKNIEQSSSLIDRINQNERRLTEAVVQ